MNWRQPIRKLIAVVALTGLATSASAYVESFYGATTGDLVRPLVVIGTGYAAVCLTMYALEYPASKEHSWWRKRWADSMPTWAVPSLYVLLLMVVAHFVWFCAAGGFGVPEIRGGQYVLDNRGRIIVMTEPQYHAMRSLELREFAVLMFACYWMPALYGWFRGFGSRAMSRRNPATEKGS